MITQKLKVCETCGKEFFVPACRKEPVKYCCRKCADEGRKAKPNCVCKYCGKAFHKKESAINKYKRTLGVFCSQECTNKYKEIAYKGSGNHQYGLIGPLNASFKNRDLKANNHKLIETMVYCPGHPFANKYGRVKRHRLIVEKYYYLFDAELFMQINGAFYLREGIEVHHINGNHNDDSINNLYPCTKSEHQRIHSKDKIIIRDSKGRITAVIKRGELLGNPEVDNQQPSQQLTMLEGSETNS